MTTTETTDTPTPNGVNVAALLGARQALTEAPEAARFTWRARCQWVNGTHSQTTIDSFAGLGAEHHHRQPYTVDADHPEIFASADNGPTPPELALGALASCLMAGLAMSWHLSARGIDHVVLEGGRWPRPGAPSAGTPCAC